jgi:hypothetical protein
MGRWPAPLIAVALSPGARPGSDRETAPHLRWTVARDC